jgi:5-methylcytosine-specific restriction endonuclease McrA
MAQRTCVICSSPLTGRQTRYCSPLCSSHGFNVRRKADGRLAEYNRRPEVKAKVRVRNMQRAIPAVCEHCGIDYLGKATQRATQKYCSCTCRDAARLIVCPLPKDHSVRKLIRARNAAIAKAEALATRSPLRAAWEDEDWDTVQAELLDRTQPPDSNGCRVWTGRRSRDGYAYVAIGKKRYAAYRVMAATLKRGHIGPEPVHHICANGLCITPDHLQVVTSHANVAEMLLRHWYEARILELSRALIELDPAHPALAPLALAPAPPRLRLA